MASRRTRRPHPVGPAPGRTGASGSVALVPDDTPDAPRLDELVVADSPESWETAGFAVDDDGTCRIGSVRVRLVGRSRGRRILEWSLRGVDDGPIDGIPTRSSERELCRPADHPNGSVNIDHVVLLTPDNARTTAAFESFGLRARRVRETDQYGAPFLQTFFRAGEVIVELIGPEQPSGDGACTFFGLAHTVRDLAATKAVLGEHLGEIKDAVQPGRRIATLRHGPLGMSVATAFMSPVPDSLTVPSGGRGGGDGDVSPGA
jgi:hypothetical protein